MKENRQTGVVTDKHSVVKQRMIPTNKKRSEVAFNDASITQRGRQYTADSNENQ